MASKLLCELVFNNEQAQMKMCELCDFSPMSGLVTINTSIPKRLTSQISTVMNQLKDQRIVEQLADRGQKFWSYPKFEHHNIDEADNEDLEEGLSDLSLTHVSFPDPKDYLVGFFVTTMYKTPYNQGYTSGNTSQISQRQSSGGR